MRNIPLLRIDKVFIRKLALFLMGTVIIGLLGYVIIMALFYAFSIHVNGPQKWNLFDGFVGIVSVSILIGGLAYTVGDRILAEVAEAREKNKISYEIYKNIFEKLTDPKQEAARRWIIENITILEDERRSGVWFGETQSKIMRVEDWKDGELPRGQAAVKMTLNCLDYIGFIVKNKYWDVEEKGDSLDWLSPPIAKVWTRIGPYVKEVRYQRGANDYYVFAEYIGDLCVRHRQRRGHPEEKLTSNTP